MQRQKTVQFYLMKMFPSTEFFFALAVLSGTLCVSNLFNIQWGASLAKQWTLSSNISTFGGIFYCQNLKKLPFYFFYCQFRSMEWITLRPIYCRFGQFWRKFSYDPRENCRSIGNSMDQILQELNVKISHFRLVQSTKSFEFRKNKTNRCCPDGDDAPQYAKYT